ncbi:carboxylating nicotinate-nucleotide diphosphorylase [Tissierella creatinophila]|uniref:Probable nicotinate-nucleotide pyrophosphorylase [carboxylating] n=1 Tax=Tissierella creatinophila DSM 6911 TaxID=1123403 RepID=A0A1U7M2Z0_TISCR|nr:carboxylating nicotinate-nucleotide diphosphorylase [Tissierella creatinophila]OLS01645.1 putative nicotinate-nucleotide pyrophosphorylase [Tissierella creatinophila DSM 6911]
MNWLNVDDIIRSALLEDIPYDDITTNSIISKNTSSSVDLLVKEDGIIAGLDVFKRVFSLLGDVNIELFSIDGKEVYTGEHIAKITGNTRNILAGERVALNYLQRMSGIATLTRKFVKKLEGSNTKLLDTRKTSPNNRIFEKCAVKIGGGCNHRFNLSDGVLIKDNHIKAAGGIKNAIELVRKNVSFVRKIEVEVESLEEIEEALEAGADIIMLDNMDLNTMKKAVEMINKLALTEASGNITLENISDVAKCGVDYISTGTITHSYNVLDLSMKNLINI